MRSTLRIIAQGILFGISATLTMGLLTYAAGSMPDSPIAGVPVGGMFMQYFNQMLVDTSTATTGVVKNSAKTYQIATTTNGTLSKWNGSKLVDAGGVYMDASNKLVISSLQVSGGNSSDVMISDANGNVHWGNVDSIVSSQSGRVVECNPTKSCASQPNYPNAVFTPGVPTSANQAWVQSSPSCGYSCKSGFTGIDCNQAVLNSTGTIYISNTSSSDLSKPNGTADNSVGKKIYLIIDGVIQSNPPKGCAQPASWVQLCAPGAPGASHPTCTGYLNDLRNGIDRDINKCNKVTDFRDYTADEWINGRIVSGGVGGFPGQTFPDGLYNIYSLYGTTISKVGSATLASSPTPKGAVYLSNTSGNDLSNQNGSVYTDKQLYVILDGVDQNHPPKGCAKPKGNPGCDNPNRDLLRDGDGFRDYTAAEWVTPTRIVSGGVGGIAPNSFPAGDYEFYSLYGTTITKVGYGKLVDPVPTTTYTDASIVTKKTSYVKGEYLYGYITGGNSTDTWGCIDIPDGNECLNNRGWRKLGSQVDDWYYYPNTGRLEARSGLYLDPSWPSGTYKGYVRISQNGQIGPASPIDLQDPVPVITIGTFAGVCGGDGLIDTEYYCGGIPGGSGWVPQPDGCYHRCLGNISGGTFAGICGGNGVIDTEYKCATPNYGGSLGSPWVNQGGSCYHRCL